VRKITALVVHCSDSDVKAHDSIEVIRKWHVEERGFSDIGYHWVITKDGTVHSGRPEEQVGAHVAGHNAGTLGICLCGRREFTKEQFSSLEKLCFGLVRKYGLEKSDIVGHRELDPKKTCPNFDVHALISSWEWH
jgi:N-acetylmuramoyl-L-alanine amidase